MAYVITEACVDLKDKTCIAECPVDCIYEGDRMMYINPVECVDCGACEPVCPVGAIYYEAKVPEGSVAYKESTKEFFAALGATDGATDVGISPDAKTVAALPPKDQPRPSLR